ncbi:MAG: hypothetical protein WED10_04435 [Brumimicrobium sp.]
MKTQKVIFRTILVSMFFISATSCKKEIKGCTDSTADNHMVEATVDDGSCNYHGKLTSWYDTETRDSLLNNNIASVGVYVDGENYVNYNPTFILWSDEPECSITTIGNSIQIDNTKTRTISLTVRALDSTNTEVRQWIQSMNINSGECELYKITW